MAHLRREGSWVAWDVCILTLYVACAVVLWRRSISYLSGLTNYSIEAALPFGSLLLYGGVCLVTLMTMGLLAVRLVHQRNCLPLWGNIVRGILILIMSANAIAAVTSPHVPGHERFAQGFEKRIRDQADILAIRRWAGGLTAPVGDDRVPEELWLEEVRRLSPLHVFYKDSGVVMLCWGGGFSAACGLVIGPEDMSAPESTNLELVACVEPGAYLVFTRG